MNSPITKIFEQFSNQYLKNKSASIQQHKVIDCIKACKTGQLGYNVQACQGCGVTKTHYNSCSNRHCPNCQAINKERWILAKGNDVLPVKYHHTVFTIPAELRTLFMFNKKTLYNLLFKSAWETIDSFSANPINGIEAKMGMIAILHTWKQDLEYHPHLHCIIPSGGITQNNKWKSSPTNGDYLFNSEALARTFKGKFLSHLKKTFNNDQLEFWDLKDQSNDQFFYQLKEELYDKKWVVYSKKSFENEKSVFEYLGRYTHKIAISNARIVSVTDKEVSFEYTDRADGYKKKIRTVSGVKFIELFLKHVLPKGFMKIRNYGFLSSRNKVKMLQLLHQYFELPDYEKNKRMLAETILELAYGVKIGICKHCGGQMVVIESKPRAKPRASPIVA